MKKFVSVLMALLFLLGICAFTTAEDAELPKFSGLVTDINEGSLTIVNAYGNTLAIKVDETALEIPVVGSFVEVEYVGDPATVVEIVSINVITPATVKTMSGTIETVETNKITVKPAKGASVSFGLLSKTTVTGKAESFKVGDSVTVTYSECAQFMTTVNLAVNIDITKVKQEKKEDDTTNKKMTGKVNTLSGSSVTIMTSKGKNWTFKLSSRTKYTSRKTLEIGCTVTITYDGYASNRPLAKKVNVTKTAEETARGKIYKKSGTVAYFEGMAIGLTNGFRADVAYAKHSGKGDRVPGRKVTVYYWSEGGEYYASKIKWK